MRRFLLRLSDELHSRLKLAATEHGMSMNEYCVARLSSDSIADDAVAEIAARARAEVGNALVGIVMFGSLARGTETTHSDVDLLLVIDRSMAITRELYRRWDAAPLRLQDRIADVHFVHLPDRGVAGGVWAEAAVEGLVLLDRGRLIHAALAAVRRELADGLLRRHTVHGQSYWTTHPTMPNPHRGDPGTAA